MRWIKLTVLTLMLLLPLSLVSGQSLDKRTMLCGDLAEADCQILVENDAAMNGVNAFAFDGSMTLDVAASDLDSMALKLDASGSMSFSSETMDAILAMEDSLMEMDGQAMPDEMVAILDAAIAGMTAELTADLQITSQDGIEDMSLQLLIKDGVVVLNAAAVAEVTGESMGGMEWFGIDATGLFALLTSETDMQDASMTDMDMTDISEMLSAQTVTRLADSEIDSVPVAVFEIVQNMDHMLGLLDSEATAATVESSATLNATMRQYIGLEDFYTHRTEIVLNSVDETLMTTMDMSLSTNFSDFNVPVNVEIPEDAFVFPLEFLTQMASQQAN